MAEFVAAMDRRLWPNERDLGSEWHGNFENGARKVKYIHNMD